MATPAVTFGVQVDLESKAQLLEAARRAESLGFDMLTVADHPGTSPSPFPTLAAAAAVTDTIRLGPYVANAGLRTRLDLAADVATLDVLSDGRAFVGLGAGHTPVEWSSRGLRRPGAADRITRLIETADAVRLLLDGDETVSFDGEAVLLVEARLEAPRPVQESVPMLIGGNKTQLLRHAGAHADIIALSGLGRTLPDGHRHDVAWASDRVGASCALINEGAVGRDPQPVRQALVQAVIVTDNRQGVATKIADRIGADVDNVLAAPFLLIGTINDMIESIERSRERWGITSYVVRESAIDAVSPLIEYFTN